MAHAASYIRDVVSNGTNFNLPGSRWHQHWNESDQREPETSTLMGSALDNSSMKFASRRKCPIPLSTHAHLQSDTSPTRQLLAHERNVPHLRQHPLHHQQLYSPASSTDDSSSSPKTCSYNYLLVVSRCAERLELKHTYHIASFLSVRLSPHLPTCHPVPRISPQSSDSSPMPTVTTGQTT